MDTIRTSLKPGITIYFVVATLILAGCGVYGAYNYFIGLPERAAEFDRYQAAKAEFTALQEAAGSRALTEAEKDAYEEAESTVNSFDEPPLEPNKFDRNIQLWVWLVGGGGSVPITLWALIRKRRKYSELRPDGTLVTPVGTYPPERITDIDMSTWRSRDPAVRNAATWRATVSFDDGKKWVLDDYEQRGSDKIINVLAHRFHPDAWDASGERIASEAPSDDDQPTASIEPAGAPGAIATATTEESPTRADDDDVTRA